MFRPDIPPSEGRPYSVDYRTVSSESFRKRYSRWSRFKRWFKRVILRRDEIETWPIQRVIENQFIKDMYRVEDSRFFEVITAGTIDGRSNEEPPPETPEGA